MTTFSDVDEKEFKMNFVSTFLATWIATNYDTACQWGEHERLDNPPIEDAEYHASVVWNKYKDMYL